MEYKLYLNEIMQYNHLYTIYMYLCMYVQCIIVR